MSFIHSKKVRSLFLIALFLLSQIYSNAFANETNTVVNQATQSEIDAMRAAAEAAAKGDPAANQATQQSFDALSISQKKILIEKKLNGVIELSQNPNNQYLDWNSAISTLTIALREITKLIAHGESINK